MPATLHSRLWPALAAVAACGALVAANAGAQSAPSTLHLVAKQQRSVGFMPAGRPHQGSRFGFGDRVRGDDTGYSRGVCTFIGRSSGLLCTLELHLSKGTITAQGEIPERAHDTPVAITGGTGAYDGARGTALATDTGGGTTTIAVRLLP
jgi:hypothetical protein